VQLKIKKLVYGGDGLARLPPNERGPGKTAFVPFVLEDELVEASPDEHKPGFVRATLDSIIEPSRYRVHPGCPYFQRCGGCQYQHTSYDHQLEIKTSILRETLKRTAKFDLPCELKVHGSPEWGYRNRVRLKIQSQPEFALGYYTFRSHDLLPVEQCPISSPLINRAMQALWDMGRSGQIATSLHEIEFFTDNADAALLIELNCQPGTTKPEAGKLAESLSHLVPEVKGVAVFEQPFKPIPELRKLAAVGDPFISYQTQLASYRVSAGSFFQVNRFLIDQLIKLVTADASGNLALDLYAGVGLFTSVLARSFAQVISGEASQTAYSDLRQNAPREVKAARATTEQFLAKASGIRPDWVVADPPRNGLGENVIRNLRRLEPPRITYVSCDPSTLARDLRIFLTLGYRIEAAHMVDLFPQTYHLESVFHLAR